MEDMSVFFPQFNVTKTFSCRPKMTLQKEYLSVLTEEGVIRQKGEVMVGEKLLPHASFHFLVLSP